MALTSTGLTGAGKTTNFLVQYETGLFDSLPAAQKAIVKSNLIANANALLAVIENEFTVTTGWFNTPAGKFGTGNRQVVNLNKADGSGANNSGYGSALNLDAQSGNSNAANAAGIVEMVFMNEWVEMPLWIWSLEDLRRRRAFVRHHGEQWELWDGEGSANPECRGS